jgi:hypothetical protein
METVKFTKSIVKKFKSISKYLLPVLILTILELAGSCSSKDDPTPAGPAVIPPATCKVKSQTISGTGRESATVTYTYNFIFTFTYDENGNQVGSNSTYTYNYSDGKKQTSTNSVSNQYDKDNFLLRRIYQYNATGKDGTTTNSNTNTEHSYTDGRLSKTTHNINDNGKVSNYSFSYEYSADGKLTKQSTTYDNSYTKYEWNGVKLQKMTHVDQVGNSSSPFLEYNSEGLLIKSIRTFGGGSTDEYRYQYDNSGQQIRFERYINTKPASAYTYEYDDKINPGIQLYPKPKGHPTIPDTQAEYVYKNNQTKFTYYSGDPVTGTWKTESSTVYTLDYNAQNLPVEIVSQALDKDGIQTSTSRTTYEYIDCQ